MFFYRYCWAPVWASLFTVFLNAQGPLSSGVIDIYFSHPIDESIVGNQQPAGIGYQVMLTAIINRINQAEQQIDVAMYNNNRSDITNALKAAYARGVRIRYIAAAATANYALNPAPPFPVSYGNAAALMHNKFMVIDPNLPDKAWVMSGSLNWTTSNITQDYNNLLFIQDQALAKTYQMEFEEMWGGAGGQPVPANARFGSAKTDNTPHTFQIGGKTVQLLFSPSDGVTDHIVDALATADHRADFALFSFTKNEIGDILVDLFDNTGIPVQGMIENTNDLGCEINYLSANGLSVFGHLPGGSLHHKYGVVDAGFSAAQPLVITGSHNWTQAAESANDENTLIFYDPDIALLFKAEFNRRWTENLSSTSSPAGSQWHLYPNPLSERLNIEAGISTPPNLLLFEIWDMTGRMLARVQAPESDTRIELDFQNFPPGNYILKLIAQDGVAAFSVQKI
jgi:phosphatidylserine/phosphatidylglycerophosphate/cardiolipin synthase-like enzyme